MANDENLIPFNERCREDAERIRRKGAYASHQARREKKGIRSALKMMAELDHPNDDLKAELEELGVETTNEVALAFTVFMNAIKRGDYKAMESIMSAIGDHADKEQAQIKKLNAETEKTETVVKLATQSDEERDESVERYIEAMNRVSMDGVFDDD